MAYAIFGGADFGGGIWSALASGPRAGQQRNALYKAIGPVWETNNVWLVLAVVVLLTQFPGAMADLFTALLVPLSVGLIGVVFRGGAFAFRNFARESGSGRGAGPGHRLLHRQRHRAVCLRRRAGHDGRRSNNAQRGRRRHVRPLAALAARSADSVRRHRRRCLLLPDDELHDDPLLRRLARGLPACAACWRASPSACWR